MPFKVLVNFRYMPKSRSIKINLLPIIASCLSLYIPLGPLS